MKNIVPEKPGDLLVINFYEPLPTANFCNKYIPSDRKSKRNNGNQ